MRALGSLIMLVALALPCPASAACAGGQVVGADCMGLTAQGCCDWEDGGSSGSEILYWCDGGTLCALDCETLGGFLSTYGCGWSDYEMQWTCGDIFDLSYMDSDFNFGQCAQGGGTTDPGTGTGDAPGTGTGQACGGIGYEGCCDGELLTWCEGGELRVIDCTAGLPDSAYCGWLADQGFYDCGTPGAADPSGYNPKSCSGGGTVTPPGGGVCTPDCAGMSCGPDGCGGTCGYCSTGQQCAAGQCVNSNEGCQPTCKRPDGSFKDCGDNGCGGMCGACGLDLACDAQGYCVTPELAGCQPTCGSKECGPDGCGGSCGVCREGYGCYEGYCVFGMECEPACEERVCGDDGCGGSCGVCPADAPCTEGQCTGADGAVITNPDDPCPPGQFLYYGVCVSEDGEAPAVVPNDAVAGDTDSGGGGCASAPLGRPLLDLLLLMMVALALPPRRARDHG